MNIDTGMIIVLFVIALLVILYLIIGDEYDWYTALSGSS